MGIDGEVIALRRLARALTARAEEAEDLVQDTLLAALRRPPADAGTRRAWLATVLRNRWASRLRADHRERARAEATAVVVVDAVPSLEHVQLLRELVEEIAALDPEDRALLDLRYWQGLSATECAERLGRPASTIRTQVQRALARLRERLDRRRGGRQAWLPALLPAVDARRPIALGAKSLSVGAVFASTILWLGIAAPQGCGAHVEDAAVTPSTRDADAASPTAAPSRRESSRTHAASAWRLPTPDPDDDDDVMSDWSAKIVGANGGVHPQMAVAMALRGVWERLGACHPGADRASARVTLTIRFDPDGSTSFERVDFTRVVALPDDEQECVRQTISAREIQVKPIDVTQLGFAADVTLEYQLTSDIEIEDGDAEQESVVQQPLPVLYTKTQGSAPLRAAIAACGSGPTEAELTFDPKTGALLRAHAIGIHADDAQGRCVADELAAQVTPVDRFEPKTADDALVRCTFDDVAADSSWYACKNVGARPATMPHPIE